MRIEDLTNFIKGGNEEKIVKKIKEDVPSFEDTLKSENSKKTESKFIPFTKDGFMSDNSSLVEMFKFFDIVDTTQDPPTDNENHNNLTNLITDNTKEAIEYSFDSLPKDLKNQIGQAADKASFKYHIPKELIYAIIDQESSFNPYSVNHNKDGTTDRGLMQVNYDHNIDIMKELNIKDKNQLFDIDTNIEAGTAILARDFQKYGNWPTAIKAYNGINSDNWGYVKSVLSKIKKYQNVT
ncbi:Lytic transglycosylase catalytic [Hydrogenobaculum sp. Y04AAS1]|uniref:transglycosylase SLT domain-containing protein n=1 Tax=Hydrogenobaculum sp. (strain Y04AAS1) TaxID=380749 RepID=UPI00015BC8FB|nr:Lytic transglycosylase catalytic [Hydrogenobaculum sp. Y04AAS1]HCT66283.1 lytic transglycosylase domain-containing protein [Hydrogenobaculum sp.]